MADIENRINNKTSIYKSGWKERHELEKEIDAKNVIYNLIDVENFEFYIGESKSLKNRLSIERPEIPNWTHYRFDMLPKTFTKNDRVAIERLLIKIFSSVLNSRVKNDIKISENYVLKNKKIDN